MQTVKRCKNCDKLFVAKAANTQYCNAECRKKAYKEQRAAVAKKIIIKTCPWCKKEFETATNRKNYCCEECAKKMNVSKAAARERNRQKKRTEQRRRLANKEETAAINEEARSRHMTYGQYQAMLYAQSIRGEQSERI